MGSLPALSDSLLGRKILTNTCDPLEQHQHGKIVTDEETEAQRGLVTHPKSPAGPRLPTTALSCGRKLTDAPAWEMRQGLRKIDSKSTCL